MASKVTPELKEQIIYEYQNEPVSINVLSKRHNVDYCSIKKWLQKNNIPSNGYGRFDQPYEIVDDYATIRIRKGDSFVYAKIDIEDIDRCKEVGIWSMTSAGYINNAYTGMYLHRFIMNCPDGLEVDHIHHDTLDNRKSELRIATSSQQNMNMGLRKDNTSGHRGVYYDKSRDTWNVNINYKEFHLRKRFKNYDEACNCADEFYEKNFGEFRYQNTK